MDSSRQETPLSVAAFILAAPYIAENFLKFLFENHNHRYFILFITSNGFNDDMRLMIETAKNSGICEYHLFESFELSKMKLAFKKNLQKTNYIINSHHTVDKCYVQSLEPFLARYILHNLKKRNNHITIIGTMFSMPVFLFRDSRFISTVLKPGKFMEAIKQNNIRRGTKIIPKPNILKTCISQLIEICVDLLLIRKEYRKNRFLKATSYIPRKVANKHITDNKYYSFCLNQLYTEKVELISIKAKSVCEDIIAPSSTNIIVILGPVSERMINDYILDLIDLKKCKTINSCIIRPHPRFLHLSEILIKEIHTKKLFDNCMLGSGNLNTNIFLGYYSSLLENVLALNNKNVYVSERATFSRYPSVKLDLLSGNIFGFNKDINILKNDTFLSHK